MDHTNPASGREPRRKRDWKHNAEKLKWLRAIRYFILAAAVLFLLFRFVIGFSVIDGNSMAPSLTDGDLVFYTRIGNRYQRGDLVAVSLPSGEFYVKRVVAVGGDVVDLRDGVVYINGVAEDSGYVKGPTLPEEGAFHYPLTVDPGSVFIMGDNRMGSIDSRFLGPVAERQVSGALRLRVGWLYIQGL